MVQCGSAIATKTRRHEDLLYFVPSCLRGYLLLLIVFTFSLPVTAAPTDSPLIQAVKSKDVNAVRELLKQRVDVNAAQGDGATPLHWAAHRDDLATADLLIRAGARANVANDLGTTPLHLATASGPAHPGGASAGRTHIASGLQVARGTHLGRR